jgi:hypothetical protein
MAQVQLSLAQQVLGAQEQGRLPEKERGLLPWATAMCELEALVPGGVLTAAISSAHGPEQQQRAARLRATIDAESLRVDMVAAQSMGEQNDSMRSQAAEDEEARRREEEAWALRMTEGAAARRGSVLAHATVEERTLDSLLGRRYLPSRSTTIIILL